MGTYPTSNGIFTMQSEYAWVCDNSKRCYDMVKEKLPKIQDVFVYHALETKSLVVEGRTALSLTWLYASFLKGQGHQGIFFSVKGTLWWNCKFLLEHFKGTKAMTRGHGDNRLGCLCEVSGLPLTLVRSSRAGSDVVQCWKSLPFSM